MSKKKEKKKMNGRSKMNEYLDDTKNKLGLSSDYALANDMNISRTTLKRYREGVSNFDEYTCFKIAEILEIDSRNITIEIKAESEKNKKKKEFWQSLKNQSRGAFGAVVISSTLLSPVFTQVIDNNDFSNSESSHRLYIM